MLHPTPEHGIKEDDQGTTQNAGLTHDATPEAGYLRA